MLDQLGLNKTGQVIEQPRRELRVRLQAAEDEPARAFDEKVESMMVDSQDGANQIQHPHWGNGGQ